MPKVLILLAHPRLETSRSNRALLRHIPQNEDVTFGKTAFHTVTDELREAMK